MKPSFKSKLTFKTRMILINTAISVFIIALIGFVIVQGIVTYSFNNYVSNLVTTANEATTLIKQSISSTQTTGQESAIYKSGGSFYAQKISQIYSIQVILYDTDLNIVGSSFDNLDNTYTNYASTVMDSGVASYVYTSIDNSNYVILFTPMTINNTEIGLSALFVSTAATDKLVSKTLLLFLYAIIGAAIVSALTFAYANSRMFRPITQLTDYSKNAAKGDLQSFPNIDYRGEDEIKDLIVSTSSMVSQLKQKIDESNFEREKLSAVISSMQDAVIAVNLSNEILTTNKKLNEFFSTDSNYFEIIPHIDDTIKKVFSTREDVSYEFQYGEKYFVMSGNLIATSNNEDGVLIVIRDITALKKIEEEQNKFISSVSHELRTPLTTINGYIDMLQRRGTDDPQLTQKALETTKKETNRLLRLVNDLLNINRFHSTDFEFIFTNIDPNALIEEAVNEMNIKTNPFNSIVVYTPIELPEIKGDYDRLKQVLLNVIDNAIKYSNEEDIVKVTATYDEKFLEITVRDFGEGIPEEKKEKVFDTFYRVEEDRNRTRGGFGLGLSIVKDIIQRHNGKIRIDSMPNQGTLVSILLPLIETKGAEQQ
jgi:signal transduction histidine kinase